MKTITEARKKIDLLKSLRMDIPVKDKEGLDDIDKLIKKEYKFIEKKEKEIQQRAIDEAKKAIDEAVKMFKADSAIGRALGIKEEQPYKKVEYYKNISQSKMNELHELKNNVDADGYVVNQITTESDFNGRNVSITFIKQHECNCY